MSENYTQVPQSESLDDINTEEQISLKEKIANRIEEAIGNPIFESRLGELENQLQSLNDRFIETGHRDVDQIAAEDSIEEEILRSTAIADNLPEFQEMLTQLSNKIGSEYQWNETFLAHENSHANVAEQTGHQWVGYGAVFIKDEEGKLSSIQPLHFTKPQIEWGPKETLEKNIEVTEAPERYGDQMSELDIISSKQDRDRLNRIIERENEDKLKLDEVRKKLGLS